MPECFSRPICRLAMILNDNANDLERQRLLPFVTRLACADTPEVERARTAYIIARTLSDYSFDEGLNILEGALAIGRQAEGLGCEMITRMEETQRTASRSTSVPETFKFSKVKQWFMPAKAKECS
jgi:hypothetical protein